MKIAILLTASLLLNAYEVNYEKLTKSKADFKKEHKISRASRLEKVKKQEQKYVEIIHNEIDAETIDFFSKTYELSLHKCIAKKICIYKYNGKLSQESIIKKIKDKELNIKAVYDYERHNLVAF